MQPHLFWYLFFIWLENMFSVFHWKERLLSTGRKYRYTDNIHKRIGDKKVYATRCNITTE